MQLILIPIALISGLYLYEYTTSVKKRHDKKSKSSRW